MIVILPESGTETFILFVKKIFKAGCCTKIANLRSSQEGTNTRVVQHMMYAVQHMMYAVENHHSSAILVRSRDSDMFLILLYYVAEPSATIIFDAGHGNYRRLLDLCALLNGYGQEYCETRLFLLAFTHYKTTSVFVHIGKVKPIKLSHTFSKV